MMVEGADEYDAANKVRARNLKPMESKEVSSGQAQSANSPESLEDVHTRLKQLEFIQGSKPLTASQQQEMADLRDKFERLASSGPGKGPNTAANDYNWQQEEMKRLSEKLDAEAKTQGMSLPSPDS